MNWFSCPVVSALSRFSTQTAYHFTSSSVLIIYESPSTTAGDGAADDQINVSVKLVDFAHTVDSNTVDDNFLTGLKALMSILSTILEEHVARRSRMSWYFVSSIIVSQECRRLDCTVIMGSCHLMLLILFSIVPHSIAVTVWEWSHSRMQVATAVERCNPCSCGRFESHV